MNEMVSILRRRPTDDGDPRYAHWVIAVKTFTATTQLGMIRKIPRDATEEELQLAEDRCLNSINLYQRRMPTWEGSFSCPG